MTNKTTIELPRQPGESAKAFRARTEYVLMGPDRSLEKTRQKLTKSSPGYTRVLKAWSERYGWVESAKQYDEQIAFLTVQESAQQYQDDLKAFRVKYGKAGDDLHKVTAAMLSLFARNLQGRVIEGKDGQRHTIPAIEMNAGTLGQIKAAFQTAADLEALALRVEHLLGQMDAGSSNEQ